MILANLSKEPFRIEPKDRIAQLVVKKFISVEWESVEFLPISKRGIGGFGSTGKN